MSSQLLRNLIETLYQKYAPNFDGELANYIPELANANPADFGISVMTADGNLVSAGTTEKPFTIQSVSKPLAYGMALELYGPQHVAKYVGVEPSGDVFHSIVLEKGTNRPFNPMINSGAITVTSMLYDHYGDETFDIILSRFSEAAGTQLTVDESVYRSESLTGYRNRAISYMLLNFGMVSEKVHLALEVYFKQCAIQVTCDQLATIAGTLSNLGENPRTGKVVYDIDRVKEMLSIMLTCGMYDYSGQWAYNVGVPAKSGVSGGIMSVINRQLGCASYSPLLDERGNSSRGINASIDLAGELGLHTFDCMNSGSDYLKAIL